MTLENIKVEADGLAFDLSDISERFDELGDARVTHQPKASELLAAANVNLKKAIEQVRQVTLL